MLAAEQSRDTANLSLQQQKDDLATQLAKSIQEQNDAYNTSIANVETAALNRGMGRSSYTLQTLANQGNALAEAVRQLTDESNTKSSQIDQQMALNTSQAQDTINQANTSYASDLAAKIQELRNQRTSDYNSAYMSAISSAMGQQTTGTANTVGTETSKTTGNSTTNTTGASTTNTTGTTDTTGSSVTDEASESTSKTKSKSTTGGGGGGGG